MLKGRDAARDELEHYAKDTTDTLLQWFMDEIARGEDVETSAFKIIKGMAERHAITIDAIDAAVAADQLIKAKREVESAAVPTGAKTH